MGWIRPRIWVFRMSNLKEILKLLLNLSQKCYPLTMPYGPLFRTLGQQCITHLRTQFEMPRGRPIKLLTSDPILVIIQWNMHPASSLFASVIFKQFSRSYQVGQSLGLSRLISSFFPPKTTITGSPRTPRLGRKMLELCQDQGMREILCKLLYHVLILTIGHGSPWSL